MEPDLFRAALDGDVESIRGLLSTREYVNYCYVDMVRFRHSGSAEPG